MKNIWNCIKFEGEIKDGEKVYSIKNTEETITYFDNIPEDDFDELLEDIDTKARKQGKTANEYLDSSYRKSSLKEFIKEFGKELMEKLRKHRNGEVKITEKTDALGQKRIRKTGIGGHSYQAVREDLLKIKGDTIPPDPKDDEPFVAMLKMFDKDNPTPEGFINKNNSTIRIDGKQQRGAATMFPKNWNEARIEEEIAFAYKNKIKTDSKIQNNVLVENYVGKASTGMEIEFIYNDGKLITTPPKVNHPRIN